MDETAVRPICIPLAPPSFSAGSYSAPSLCELEGARAEYRRPEFGGRLCFAGEASEDAMMTMNAAISSGRRAAAEVLRALRREIRARL